MLAGSAMDGLHARFMVSTSQSVCLMECPMTAGWRRDRLHT